MGSSNDVRFGTAVVLLAGIDCGCCGVMLVV